MSWAFGGTYLYPQAAVPRIEHTEIYDITQVIRNLTYAFIGHTIKCQKETTDVTIGILVPYETDSYCVMLFLKYI